MIWAIILEQEYGLDLNMAERLSSLVESSIVSINNVIASDPRIPFCGVKKVVLV